MALNRFMVDEQTSGDLESNYPHDPTDLAQSIHDYIEAQFALGWEFVGTVAPNVSATYWFVLKANGQNV